MKIFSTIVFSLIFTFSFSQKVPEIVKTEFSKEALAQTIIDSEGKETSIGAILDKHRGNVIVLEFWAGWCKDCLIGMPIAHKLKEDNPQIDFIYLSLDRGFDSWKKGIEKYNLEISDNYWFSTGWKNDFTNYIDLNWIPRYMVLDQKGNIAKYYAVAADDPEIQATINKLLSENE